MHVCAYTYIIYGVCLYIYKHKHLFWNLLFTINRFALIIYQIIKQNKFDHKCPSSSVWTSFKDTKNKEASFFLLYRFDSFASKQSYWLVNQAWGKKGNKMNHQVHWCISSADWWTCCYSCFLKVCSSDESLPSNNSPDCPPPYR